jgi:ankyrin repeat protein
MKEINYKVFLVCLGLLTTPHLVATIKLKNWPSGEFFFHDGPLTQPADIAQGIPISHHPEPNMSVLHVAATAGDLKEVLRLLACGVPVDYQAVLPHVGFTPLFAIASYGYNANRLACARALLQYGANPNIAGINNYRPLHYTVRFNNRQLAALLLEYGADIKLTDTIRYETPLQTAQRYNRKEITKLLIAGENELQAQRRTSNYRKYSLDSLSLSDNEPEEPLLKNYDRHVQGFFDNINTCFSGMQAQQVFGPAQSPHMEILPAHYDAGQAYNDRASVNSLLIPAPYTETQDELALPYMTDTIINTQSQTHKINEEFSDRSLYQTNEQNNASSPELLQQFQALTKNAPPADMALFDDSKEKNHTTKSCSMFYGLSLDSPLDSTQTANPNMYHQKKPFTYTACDDAQLFFDTNDAFAGHDQAPQALTPAQSPSIQNTVVHNSAHQAGIISTNSLMLPSAPSNFMRPLSAFSMAEGEDESTQITHNTVIPTATLPQSDRASNYVQAVAELPKQKRPIKLPNRYLHEQNAAATCSTATSTASQTHYPQKITPQRKRVLPKKLGQKCLTSQGVDINTNLSSVRSLLKNGADPNIINTDGTYPLHFAVANGDLPLVALLLEYNADINAIDSKYKKSAFDLAVDGMHTEIVHLFVSVLLKAQNEDIPAPTAHKKTRALPETPPKEPVNAAMKQPSAQDSKRLLNYLHHAGQL